MTTIIRSLTVRRPITEVYQYMSDFSTTEQWDPNVLRANKITLGLVKEGTVFKLLVKSKPRHLDMTYRVHRLKPDAKIELHGEAPNFTVIDTIHLATVGSHHTEIQYRVQLAMPGLSGKLLDTFPALLNPMIDKAVGGLARALNNEPERTLKASRLADRLLLPGMLKFTKYGYRSASQQWKGLSTNLNGKQAVVTGATSGLGKETALTLAKMGAKVLIVGRNKAKIDAVAQFIELESGQHIDSVLADLSLMNETQRAAEEIKTKCPQLDILINNAGALFNQRETTTEGFERSFALLLLSPFVLTQALLPLLKQSSHARVINVSSGGMYTQKLRLNDLQSTRGRYDGPQAYARAKRGLIDLTEVWARQHKTSPVRFNAMHPGWADTPAVASSLPSFYQLTNPILRSPKEGADTIIWLASAPDVADESGQFWLDRKQHTTAVLPFTRTNPSTQDKLYATLKDIASSI